MSTVLLLALANLQIRSGLASDVGEVLWRSHISSQPRCRAAHTSQHDAGGHTQLKGEGSTQVGLGTPLSSPPHLSRHLTAKSCLGFILCPSPLVPLLGTH